MGNIYAGSFGDAIRGLLSDTQLCTTDLSQEIALLRVKALETTAKMAVGVASDDAATSIASWAVIHKAIDELASLVSTHASIQRTAKAESLPVVQLIGIVENAITEVLDEVPGVDHLDVIKRMSNVIDAKMSLPATQAITRLPADDVLDMDNTVPLYKTNGHKPTNGVA